MFDKETGGLVMCKSSWHFKTVSYVFPWYFRHESRVNLCPYMRRLVFSMLALPFVIGWNLLPDSITDHKDIARAFIIYTLILTVFSASFAVWYPDTGFLTFFLYGLIGGISIAALVAGVYIGGCALQDKWDSRPTHYSSHKNIGIAKAYIGAKHDKICPSIKFCDAPDYDKNGVRKKSDEDCP